MTDVADTIRQVAAKMQIAIDQEHRSCHIDTNDLIEVLLSIADGLDPPLGDRPTDGN